VLITFFIEIKVWIIRNSSQSGPKGPVLFFLYVGRGSCCRINRRQPLPSMGISCLKHWDLAAPPSTDLLGFELLDVFEEQW